MDEQELNIQPASGSNEEGVNSDTASLAAEVQELEQLRRNRTPFRVLILGRANAGKTTILERLCGSSADKAIVYRNGKVVEGLKIKGEQGRGEHNISDEIVFPTLPGFVFHDSRGVESGGTDEKTKIEEFVKVHSTSVTRKDDILHAVWICLPLDTDRPLLDGEIELCKISAQHVPVVAIFTKRDARYTKALAEIKSQSTASGRAALKQARVEAEKRVDEWVKNQVNTLNSQTSRLSNHILAPNMQKADKDCERFCSDLISCTEEALPTAILKGLLSVVWVNNASELSLRIFRRILERTFSETRKRFSAQISRRDVLGLVHFYLSSPYYFAAFGRRYADFARYEGRYRDEGRRALARYRDEAEYFFGYADDDDHLNALIFRHLRLVPPSPLESGREAKELRGADIILFAAFCVLVKRQVVSSCLRAPPNTSDAYEKLCNEVVDSPSTAEAYRQLSDRIIASYGPGRKDRDMRMGHKEGGETIARRLVEIVEECLEKYDQ